MRRSPLPSPFLQRPLCAAFALACLSAFTPRAALVLLPADDGTATETVVVWHVLDLPFQHDEIVLEGGTPNPFFDFRLDVTFTHRDSGAEYVVPGFFDSDGNPADTGFTVGDMWRVRFVPDRSGVWDWRASFRGGVGVAVDEDPTAGIPESFDGASGCFTALPADPSAPGFRAKGRLRYEDSHLLRFAWNREAFLKAGADSPENLLGYWEFDGTFDTGGDPNGLDQVDGLHRFLPHAADYDALGGGPTWKGGMGEALIGGLNYLASAGVNSVYFVTYNIDGGDGGEVFPWASTTSKLRYDVSKLAQWERVFDHMTDLGLVMHFVLQEEENDQVLDFGSLGDQRRLYHREMIARFGCSLGLVWNLGEESSNSDQERMDFASHIRALDPYDHPIAVHTNPGNFNAIYSALLGFPDVELCSMQCDPLEVHSRTLTWTQASADAGRPWVVTSDEQNPANDGVVPDTFDPDHFTIRSEVVWGNLLAGGGGAEFYFGYGWPDDDLDCEDWRSRALAWSQTDVALSFLREEVDYAAMRAADELTTAAANTCLALDGEVYVVYAPTSTPPVLDLQGSTDTFDVSWLNARKGGDLAAGSVPSVTGPGSVSLGSPPAGGRDWVALVRRSASRAPVLSSTSTEVVEANGTLTILTELHATDADGPGDVASAGLYLFDPASTALGFFPMAPGGGDLFAVRTTVSGLLDPGRYTYLAVVSDQAGLFDFQVGAFVVP